MKVSPYVTVYSMQDQLKDIFRDEQVIPQDQVAASQCRFRTTNIPQPSHPFLSKKMKNMRVHLAPNMMPFNVSSKVR